MKLFSKAVERARSMGFSGADLFASFAAGFISASIVFAAGADFQSIRDAANYPLWISVVLTLVSALFFAAATVLSKSRAVLSWSLMALATVFSVMLATRRAGDIFFCIGLSCVLVLCAKYATENDGLCLSKIKLSERASLVITAVAAAVFTAAVFALTAVKYKSFYHSAFDFGIFCQMFDSMAETGLPLTTVERSRLLSHFAVHFSPFFYLLLPGYLIWKSPLFLLFSQALGVALGAFAVRRICKAAGLSTGISTAMSVVYLLFPTMANGCFYDFHENKFLSVLILWAVVFVLEKKLLPAGIFMFLILTVKEDAFIYVLAICLWMIVTKRNRAFAFSVAAASLLWFFFACCMIQLSGGEIMNSRFGNYSADSAGGLWDAVRNCFVDIGYLFKEVFSGADTEAFRELTYSGQKLEFVLWTAVPLLFTPFLRKRPSELILLLPLLVVNLMPTWLYQYNVDFQYTYGTAALLIISACLFLAERGESVRRACVVSMVCISIVFLLTLVSSKATYYVDAYEKMQKDYDSAAEALYDIPEDASVTAYGYLVPHLWYVDDLHTCPEYYAEYEKTDYYIIDTRYEYDGHTSKMRVAMGDDYELLETVGFIRIYRLKGYNG